MSWDAFGLATVWRRWFGLSAGKRRAPRLRLSIAPRSQGPSWHPARAPGGQRTLQVVIELEGRNTTDRDIRIARAELEEHRAEQASFAVAPLPEGRATADPAVPARGSARITLMLFLKPRPYRPGEAFADVVTLVDEGGRAHRLK